MRKLDLIGTPKTLIIPLAGRAASHLLYPQEEFEDPSARRVMQQLQYSNPLITKNPLIVKGAVGRALAFTQEAQFFVDKHPEAWVINLGCGLSDYFQWLDNGKIHFIDVDLPEVVELREQLMPSHGPRYRLLSASIFDANLFSQLNLPADQPHLFLCEGVLMYQSIEDIEQFFARFVDQVPQGSEFIFDHIFDWAVGSGRYNPLFRKWKTDFRWGLKSYQELSKLNSSLTCIHTRSLDATSLPFPWVKNLLNLMRETSAHSLSVLRKEIKN